MQASRNRSERKILKLPKSFLNEIKLFEIDYPDTHSSSWMAPQEMSDNSNGRMSMSSELNEHSLTDRSMATILPAQLTRAAGMNWNIKTNMKDEIRM